MQEEGAVWSWIGLIARVNYPMTVAEVADALLEIGFGVDFEAGEMRPIGVDE